MPRKLRLIAEGPALPPGWPRPLLRHLIVGHGLGVGARVLDTGRDDGQLVRFLCDLRLDARALADAELPEELPDRHFDLVIVRQRSEPTRAPWTADALDATACLLTAVRPGGHLVLLFEPGRVGWSIWEARRHLGCFPGTQRVVEFTDRSGPVAAWQWFRGGEAGCGLAAVTLTVPATPLTRDAWRDFAASAVVNDSLAIPAECRREVA